VVVVVGLSYLAKTGGHFPTAVCVEASCLRALFMKRPPSRLPPASYNGRFFIAAVFVQRPLVSPPPASYGIL
jgi:hypothetical protein